MKRLIVKTADCSSDYLIKTAKKCGFIIKKGNKHYKIKTNNGEFITIIPYHPRLKKEIVKGVVKRLVYFGCNIGIQ